MPSEHPTFDMGDDPMSYAGQELRCPNPDCGEPILQEPGEDPPTECPVCHADLDRRDWLHEAEPVDAGDEFDERYG